MQSCDQGWMVGETRDWASTRRHERVPKRNIASRTVSAHCQHATAASDVADIHTALAKRLAPNVYIEIRAQCVKRFAWHPITENIGTQPLAK